MSEVAGNRFIKFVGAISLILWSTFMILLALPGEVRESKRAMLCDAMVTEHGWPVVWLDKQAVTATTSVVAPSPNWRKVKDEQMQDFSDRCNDQFNFRFAEIETGFSPQFARLPASAFWSRSETYPWFKSDETFFKVRWLGVVFDLTVWFAGLVILIFFFRYLKSQNTRPWRISLRSWLALFAMASFIGVVFAFFDRQRDREQEFANSLQNEPTIVFDFTCNAPVWLERLTDYRFRAIWIRNSFRRGIKQNEIKPFGLFDRVLAIRLKKVNPLSSRAPQPQIQDPTSAATALNHLSRFKDIWVNCADHPSISDLLSRIDGKDINFLSLCWQYNFDPQKTRITHYSDLESLHIENATHIPKGFVSSFPNLQILTLHSDSVDDAFIDEILALPNLRQLATGKRNRKVFSENQLTRLREGLKAKSVDLYFQ